MSAMVRSPCCAASLGPRVAPTHLPPASCIDPKPSRPRLAGLPQFMCFIQVAHTARHSNCHAAERPLARLRPWARLRMPELRWPRRHAPGGVAWHRMAPHQVLLLLPTAAPFRQRGCQQWAHARWQNSHGNGVPPSHVSCVIDMHCTCAPSHLVRQLRTAGMLTLGL